jgi:hypothetical protein
MTFQKYWKKKLNLKKLKLFTCTKDVKLDDDDEEEESEGDDDSEGDSGPDPEIAKVRFTN